MVCIYCGSRTRVINSRTNVRTNRAWRRRRCVRCEATSTSREDVDLEESLRIKHSDGQMQPFMRDVLYLSVVKSLDHLPSAAVTATALCETIIRSITNEKPLDPQITTASVAQHAKSVLRRFDRTAEIKYYSYLSRDLQKTVDE